MINAYPSNKKPILNADLFKTNPGWFLGAIAYRLLNLLIPKRLTFLLPKVLRIPLVPPGYSLPTSWMLPAPFPPGLSLPPGVWFPYGWVPGDPLPGGFMIDTLSFFPPGWMPGDPWPPGFFLPDGVFFPPSWKPGDFLPPGFLIDTSVYFEFLDPESPVPPPFVPPWDPGPVHPPPSPYPSDVWLERFDNTFWSPLSGSWNSSLKYWIPGGDNRLVLEASGSWPDSFRPSLMKVTYDSGLQIHLELFAKSPSPFNKICNNLSYISSGEQSLSFYNILPAQDLLTLICHMPYNCTNIEFFL